MISLISWIKFSILDVKILGQKNISIWNYVKSIDDKFDLTLAVVHVTPWFPSLNHQFSLKEEVPKSK